LQLKSLELQGFKSFPDKTSIAFSDGLTAIVGPNGSGKSNIADAVRWVMGETSSKTLRGSKMEDVIFDGTQDRKAVGFAEVSLILDNSDNSLNIDFAEVILSRRFYRTGESEYMINRAPVRLRDIHELLRDTGLGKDGYSIVGQGSITDIISLKSDERRFLFEEAAGISNFKYKKEESEKKLRNTEENLIRLSDIINELFERISPLEEQSQKAKQFIELNDEKKSLDINGWIYSFNKSDSELMKMSNIITTLQADLAQMEINIVQNEDKTDKVNQNIQAINIEIDRLNINQRETDREMQSKKSNIMLIQNDLEYTQKDIQRLTDQIDLLKNTDKQTDSEKDKHLIKIDELQKNVLNLETELEEFRGNISLSSKEESEYFNISDELKNNINTNNRLSVQKQVELSSFSQQLLNITEKTGETNEEINNAAERLSSIEKSDIENKKDIKDLEEQLQNNNNVKSGYDLKKNKKKLQFDTLTTRFNALNVELSTKKGRLDMLINMEKHFEGFGQSIKTVMDEYAKGVLTDIEGTVSSLITLEDQYITAIEISLGGGLSNIVVKDDNSAKNAMFFLKNKNAGRATFLPVASINGKKLTQNDLSSQKGYIGIASELIKFENRYEQIMNFLLGRTVICDNIDNAIIMSKKYNQAFRIVTLDGQVVNVGGSMTGGSTNRNVSVLSRKNEIIAIQNDEKSLNEDVSLISTELKKASAELLQIDGLLDGCLIENKQIEEKLIKLRADSDHYSSYTENINQQIAQMKQDVLDYGKEKVEIENRNNILNDDLTQISKIIAENEEKLKEAEEKYSLYREKTEQLQSTIHKKELVILEKNKDIENLNGLIAQFDKQQQQTLVSLNSTRDNLTELKKKITEFDNEILLLNTDIKNFQIQIDGASEEMKTKLKEKEQIEGQQIALHNELKTFYNTKESAARELERSIGANNTLKENADTIISRIWDEYELTFSEAKSMYSEPKNIDVLNKRVNEIKNKIKNLGVVNLAAIEEYKSVKERYDYLSAQSNDLISAKASLQDLIADLTREMESIFKEKFVIISDEFQVVFTELFNGGTAKLTLTDPNDVLNSNIEIYVAPPGKIIKHLSLLSGGEQSLTAIALYFAILKLKPAPFCVLDEIEAALDDVNVVRYAQYLRKLSEFTQFILITHRRGTMELSDRLYGVTMKEKGISRMLSINVNELEKNKNIG